MEDEKFASVQEENVQETISYEETSCIIDNSKMFSHCWSTNGRIGRLEYGLTLIFSILLYAILLMSGARIGDYIGLDQESDYYMVAHIISMAIPMTIMGLAAIKRAHDAGKPIEKCITPAIVLFLITLIRGGRFITLFLAVFLCWGYLLFYKSENDVNEYGTKP